MPNLSYEDLSDLKHAAQSFRDKVSKDLGHLQGLIDVVDMVLNKIDRIDTEKE